MIYGLWFMGDGLWFMVYGLWFTDYDLRSMVSGLGVQWETSCLQAHGPVFKVRGTVVGAGYRVKCERVKGVQRPRYRVYGSWLRV